MTVNQKPDHASKNLSLRLIKDFYQLCNKVSLSIFLVSYDGVGEITVLGLIIYQKFFQSFILFVVLLKSRVLEKKFLL